MLNENLKLELMVHFNGRMLHDTNIFASFEIEFISEITFVLKRETYAIDDIVFMVRLKNII
jgi:hypothetical protein